MSATSRLSAASRRFGQLKVSPRRAKDELLESLSSCAGGGAEPPKVALVWQVARLARKSRRERYQIKVVCCCSDEPKQKRTRRRQPPAAAAYVPRKHATIRLDSIKILFSKWPPLQTAS